MITWGDVIEIIVHVFDIKQTQLAGLMGCDKAAITRIKRGTQTPSYTADQLFSSVFAPDKSDGPASKGKRNSKYWLDRVKEEIESNFKEVQEDMKDCWSEKDYRIFVLILLERAIKGPPSKNSHLSSTDYDRSSETPDIDNDGDCHKSQEKASSDEVPSIQMNRLFEKAVADYKIATYICKLPDYLIEEPFYGSDIFSFIDSIQTNILAKFINRQDEEIYRKISEFKLNLEAYSSLLGMVRLSVSEKYGVMLKISGFNNVIISLIDSDYEEIRNNLDREREVSIEKGGANGLAIPELEEKMIQLEFLRSILSSHKRICELFGEICPGKTILIF